MKTPADAKEVQDEIGVQDFTPKQPFSKLKKKLEIKKEEEQVDSYGILKILQTKGRAEKSSAFNFCPFTDNSVLTVENTGKRVYLLLRNGSLIYWGSDTSSNKKKIYGSKNLNNIPQQIKCPTHIIDIACGREHCLAKGKNNKIYSWGVNTYGQLGLSGFPMNSYAIKDEPTEIPIFNNLHITTVYAKNMTSYAVSEDRVIFGWGCNDFGQLGKHEKADLEKKFQTPIPIFENSKIAKNDKDFVLFLDKRLRKVYSADVEIAPKTIIESLELNKNKHLYSREHELKEEISKLKAAKGQLRQARTNMEDFKDLIKDIQQLIVKFEDKINTLELKSRNNYGAETSVEQINFLDAHIQFLSGKEQQMEEAMKSIEVCVDPGKVKVKSGKLGGSDSQYSQSQKSNKKITEEEKSIRSEGQNKIDTTEITLSTTKDDRIAKVGDLISKVNTELQFQKHIVLNDHLKYEGEQKKKESKVKKLKEYIKTFNKVIEVSDKTINQLQAKSIIQEAKDALIKIDQEIPNFHINNLKNIDSLNSDVNSLTQILQKTVDNLKNLEEKILNLNIDKRNDFAMKITSMFNRNITLAKENNILMYRILVTTGEYYKKIFERVIVNDNPPNFNNLKYKIESVKKRMKEDLEPIVDSEEEEDIGELHSDESDNY